MEVTLRIYTRRHKINQYKRKTKCILTSMRLRQGFEASLEELPRYRIGIYTTKRILRYTLLFHAESKTLRAEKETHMCIAIYVVFIWVILPFRFVPDVSFDWLAGSQLVGVWVSECL